jgi:hypothetical protein
VDILVELGKRRMVGGQEDMIVDVALDLLRQREAAPSSDLFTIPAVSQPWLPPSRSHL